MSTISPDSVAQDQIKAFVDRILRLREETKAINGDIREVYAEAKGNGFDKTVLGKIVSYVEKRATGAADLQEAEALFDLYLSAYDGHASHAHAREDDVQPERDTGSSGDLRREETASVEQRPTDGEVIADRSTRSAHSQHGAESAEDVTQVATVRAASSAQPIQAETPNEPQASLRADTPAQTVQPHPAVATSETLTESVESRVSGEGDSKSLPASISEPAEGNTPTSAGHGDRGAVVPSAAPVVASNVVDLKPASRITFSDKPHRDCLDPERCGGFSNLKLCQRCQETAAGGQVA